MLPMGFMYGTKFKYVRKCAETLSNSILLGPRSDSPDDSAELSSFMSIINTLFLFTFLERFDSMENSATVCGSHLPTTFRTFKSYPKSRSVNHFSSGWIWTQTVEIDAYYMSGI